VHCVKNMENVTGLPGAKHKHYQERERIKANEEADEVDADVRQKRRHGVFSDLYDDGTAPVVDGWRKHSDEERLVWVSPRDAARSLHQVGVGGAIVSNIDRTSVPHLALALDIACVQLLAVMAMALALHTCPQAANLILPTMHASSTPQNLMHLEQSQEVHESETDDYDHINAASKFQPRPSRQATFGTAMLPQNELTLDPPFPESAAVCAPATAATAVRLEMHVRKGKATWAKHRLSYSHVPSSRAGTVAVVDGSQRGALWGLKAGDRPWK
jgi:hypothetical protein